MSLFMALLCFPANAMRTMFASQLIGSLPNGSNSTLTLDEDVNLIVDEDITLANITGNYYLKVQGSGGTSLSIKSGGRINVGTFTTSGVTINSPIYTTSNLVIYSGTVNAYREKRSDGTYMSLDHGLYSSGGEVNVYADASVHARGTIQAIHGQTVTLSGNVTAVSSGHDGAGVFSVGKITVNGSTSVTAYENGISTGGDLLINDGGKADVKVDYGNAFYCAGTIDVYGRLLAMSPSSASGACVEGGTLRIYRGAFYSSGGEGVRMSAGIQLADNMEIYSPTNGTKGRYSSYYTFLDANNTPAKLVNVREKTLSGTVTLSQAKTCPDESIYVLASGLVSTLGTFDTEWQRSTSQNGTFVSIGTGYTYKVKREDVGYYLRAKVTKTGYGGELYTAAIPVTKKPNTGTVTEPQLSIADNQVWVENANAAQEYVIYDSPMVANNIDWSRSRHLDTNGRLAMGGTPQKYNFVYSRLRETEEMMAGTTVVVSDIFFEVESRGFKYNGVWYDAITGGVMVISPQLGDSYTGEITIPDKVVYNGTEYNVRRVESGAFSGQTVTRVDLPKTVNNIEAGAFVNAASLKTLVVGANTFITLAQGFAGGNASGFACYVDNTFLPRYMEAHSSVHFLPWVEFDDHEYQAFSCAISVKIDRNSPRLYCYSVNDFYPTCRVAKTYNAHQTGSNPNIPARKGLLLKGIPGMRYLLQDGNAGTFNGTSNYLQPVVTTADLLASIQDDYERFFFDPEVKMWTKGANVKTGGSYLCLPKNVLNGDFTSPIHLDVELVWGDLNFDGIVDVTDVSIAIDMVLGKREPDLLLADLDGNGMVDVSDVGMLIDIVLGK